ncbi:hypothetical protein AX16_003933 [Volvariella volvacea WC 439]|nr:hypothetical protein AX16_003933 [Volvariella volvacea WC 439]
MMKGQRVKDIDVSGKPEPHQVVQRMVAQWLPDQKATKSNVPAKPAYTIRETSVVMDSYDRVMHATAHLPRKFQVQIVNTMATGTSADPIDVDALPDKQAPPANSAPSLPPPIPAADTRPRRNNPPSSIVVPPPSAPMNPTPNARASDKDTTSPEKTPAKPSTGMTKPSFAQMATRETTAPPPSRSRTWVAMPQKTEKTLKKDDRAVFHDKNTSTNLPPNTLVVRIITNDQEHVQAISTLIAAKREAILAMDPEHTIIDEGSKFLVVKASGPETTKKIVDVFNDLAAEYSKKFNKDPKYANFFAATTKIQNTAYVTTSTNKTDMAGRKYTPHKLLQTLKLNKCLTDKIFVAPLQFMGKGEYTAMLSFNVVEFGGDQNKLEGTRVLIHDGVSTILKRRFKARALFCTKCSHWGHATWTPCRSTVISCSICAGLHPANRHSPAYDNVPPKCINCNGAHPADSHDCPCYVNRHDVWELRSILERAAVERKAATKTFKAEKGKENAKDDMEIDTTREGFDIAPAEETDGWSKVGPMVNRRKGRGPKKSNI